MDIANSGNIVYKEFNKYDSNKSIGLSVTQDIEHFIEQFDPTVDTFEANYILIVTWEERVSRFQNAGVRNVHKEVLVCILIQSYNIK